MWLGIPAAKNEGWRFYDSEIEWGQVWLAVLFSVQARRSALKFYSWTSGRLSSSGARLCGGSTVAENAMLSYLRPHDPCFVGCFVGATRIALGLSQICFFRLEVSMAAVRGSGWDGNDHPSTVLAIRLTSAGGKDS